MKLKYITFLYITLGLLLINTASAQRIRKDHLEMTPAEKTAYVNALIVLRNNGTLTMMANHHTSHFSSPIHSSNTMNGEFFLPWHRLYAFQMENAIRTTSAAAAQLCIPYWDWRLENTAANVTWDDAGFLQLSTLNSPSYTITRSLGTTNILGTPGDITNMLSIPTLISTPPSPGLKSTSVNLFTYRLESWHDRGHNFVSGTMSGTASPRDPVFFLHHNFVDKLWQEWYDSDNGVVKTNYTFTNPSSSYWTWPAINPNTVKDGRYMVYQTNSASPVTQEEVWYAYNKKLVLDGINGAPFLITGTNRLYCYTAWNGAGVNGEVFVGDVKRDAGNAIVADNRGGIKVKTGATCTFSAGAAIHILPGFESEYGAVFETNIVSFPCGFNTLQSENETASTGADQLSKDNKLYAYAQTGSNTITVNYTLPFQSKVTFELFTIMGQRIYSVSVGEQQAGSNQYTITLPLASGVYLCRLITNNNEQTVKFVY